jgi:hypothetical protein
MPVLDPHNLKIAAGLGRHLYTGNDLLGEVRQKALAKPSQQSLQPSKFSSLKVMVVLEDTPSPEQAFVTREAKWRCHLAL